MTAHSVRYSTYHVTIQVATQSFQPDLARSKVAGVGCTGTPTLRHRFCKKWPPTACSPCASRSHVSQGITQTSRKQQYLGQLHTTTHTPNQTRSYGSHSSIFRDGELHSNTLAVGVVVKQCMLATVASCSKNANGQETSRAVWPTWPHTIIVATGCLKHTSCKENNCP